jgi:hypothetical protein
MGRVRMADRRTGRPLRLINGQGLSSAKPPGHSRHIDESIKNARMGVDYYGNFMLSLFFLRQIEPIPHPPDGFKKFWT